MGLRPRPPLDERIARWQRDEQRPESSPQLDGIPVRADKRTYHRGFWLDVEQMRIASDALHASVMSDTKTLNTSHHTLYKLTHALQAHELAMRIDEVCNPQTTVDRIAHVVNPEQIAMELALATSVDRLASSDDALVSALDNPRWIALVQQIRQTMHRASTGLLTYDEARSIIHHMTNPIPVASDDEQDDAS
jgi:hypothetical protein